MIDRERSTELQKRWNRLSSDSPEVKERETKDNGEEPGIESARSRQASLLPLKSVKADERAARGRSNWPARLLVFGSLLTVSAGVTSCLVLPDARTPVKIPDGMEFFGGGQNRETTEKPDNTLPRELTPSTPKDSDAQLKITQSPKKPITPTLPPAAKTQDIEPDSPVASQKPPTPVNKTTQNKETIPITTMLPGLTPEQQEKYNCSAGLHQWCETYNGADRLSFAILEKKIQENASK